MIKSAKTIEKYEGRSAWNIADELGNIAESTKNKDAVIESAKIIGKYEGMRAWSIADGLGDIAESTKDKDAVIESLKIIEKYEEIGAGNVADGLGGIAGITKDPNMIIKATRIMSLDEIVDSVKNNIYISKLVKIAAYTEDKDAVIESAKIIEKYEGRGAGNVAYGLGDIAEDTKNTDMIIKTAKIMSLDEIVDSVKNNTYIDKLVKIAAYAEDKDL